MDPTALWYALALILVLVGLAGAILPALPGVPLVFAGLLLAAWAGDFEQVGAVTLTVLGVITLLTVLVDFWASAVGARRVGASRKALAGAVIGTFAGMFFGLPGVFAGPFIGAAAGELLHQRRLGAAGQAARVGLGTWVGVVLAVGLKLMAVFAMIGIFALAWLWP